jgi:Tfp pilus assembly protein PilO
VSGVADLKIRVQLYERVQWLLAVGMLLMAAAFYALEYRPQEQQLLSLHQRIAAAQGDLKVNQERARALPDVAADVRSLRARLDRVKRLPPQEELSQTTGDLAALGQQLALQDFRLEPGSSQRGELFNCLDVSLDFSGDFRDVITFLRDADEMQRLTRVKSVRIVSTDKAKPGQVNVQVAMDLYFAPSQ